MPAANTVIGTSGECFSECPDSQTLPQVITLTTVSSSIQTQYRRALAALQAIFDRDHNNASLQKNRTRLSSIKDAVERALKIGEQGRDITTYGELRRIGRSAKHAIINARGKPGHQKGRESVDPTAGRLALDAHQAIVEQIALLVAGQGGGIREVQQPPVERTAAQPSTINDPLLSSDAENRDDAWIEKLAPTDAGALLAILKASYAWPDPGDDKQTRVEVFFEKLGSAFCGSALEREQIVSNVLRNAELLQVPLRIRSNAMNATAPQRTTSPAQAAESPAVKPVARKEVELEQPAFVLKKLAKPAHELTLQEILDHVGAIEDATWGIEGKERSLLAKVGIDWQTFRFWKNELEYIQHAAELLAMVTDGKNIPESTCIARQTMQHLLKAVRKAYPEAAQYDSFLRRSGLFKRVETQKRLAEKNLDPKRRQELEEQRIRNIRRKKYGAGGHYTSPEPRFVDPVQAPVAPVVPVEVIATAQLETIEQQLLQLRGQAITMITEGKNIDPLLLQMRGMLVKGIQTNSLASAQ